MKTRLLIIVAIMAVLGLSAAAFALNQSSSATPLAVADCCKKDGADACPMKAKGKGHDMHKDENGAKSCPMKKGDAVASADAKGCCAYCTDSCPMKKDGAVVKTTGTEEGKKCCGCDCCGGMEGHADHTDV